MTHWTCSQCGEDQIAFGRIPESRLCYACSDARRAARAFTEADAGIPKLFRGLTRESWSACFQRPWPEALKNWTGTPRWLALWGPTGTGKTGIATVLLAEHLRTGRRGRWISGPELSRRIQRDLANAEDVIAPLLVTPLLVLDEPLTGASADWYMERLVLITRTRDESCLPTIVTSQLLPELLHDENAATPPPLVSRWLSGLRVRTAGKDVRMRKARP
ncbi:MAG TPA: hypothetical protein VFR31_22110 [Thermoanaerobaculia bacterium]|nr:hypothetical protein [Thermoanaerobaculia bacterium]